VPIVFTYHTKFDVDLDNTFKFDVTKGVILRFILTNIEACDEVWAVSVGAGENLRQLGYKGDFRIMSNGVDFPKGRLPSVEIAGLASELGLPGGMPVFLFVGRMMWYKGLRFVLDGLARAKAEGTDFRMIFVGSGSQSAEIIKHAEALGLGENCIFAGPVTDRERLRAYYSLSDLFLLPSVFDNAPLVVREAAACSVASVLVRGSSSAEGVVHMENGLLIEQTAEGIAWAAHLAARDRPLVRAMGERAAETVYAPWDAVVADAYSRYGEVLERYRPSK
jgi:glycosyltransferase involved in cell wall biosynthesis